MRQSGSEGEQEVLLGDVLGRVLPFSFRGPDDAGDTYMRQSSTGTFFFFCVMAFLNHDRTEPESDEFVF